MFGAAEHRFDQKINLKEIRMLLDVDGQSLSMTRKIDSTEFEVSSSVPGIDSDTYKTKNAKKSINSFGYD